MFKSLQLLSSPSSSSSSSSHLIPSHLYASTSSLSSSSSSSFSSKLFARFADLRNNGWATSQPAMWHFTSSLGSNGISCPRVVAARSASGGGGVAGGQMGDLIKSKNSLNPVVVYSKTWCPYCGAVKKLFEELGVKYVAVELDQMVEERDLQDALHKLTGQSTVPSVFIGGKHIGGCDDTMALHQQGNLLPLLTLAGAKISKL